MRMGRPSVASAFLLAASLMGGTVYAANSASPDTGTNISAQISVCDPHNKKSFLDLNQVVAAGFPEWAQEMVQSLFSLHVDNMLDVFYEAVEATSDFEKIKEIVNAELSKLNNQNRVIIADFLGEAAPVVLSDNAPMMSEIKIEDMKIKSKDCLVNINPLNADASRHDLAPS